MCIHEIFDFKWETYQNVAVLSKNELNFQRKVVWQTTVTLHALITEPKLLSMFPQYWTWILTDNICTNSSSLVLLEDKVKLMLKTEF